MNIDKKVGIILVNYNGKEYNEECINSILDSSYKNIEIIVVDNGSKDGSVEILKEVFKEKIELILTGKNLGFSGANNIGIEKALNDGCDYIVLLNNDTIIDRNLIGNMLIASIEEHNSVISPKIYYYDNKKIIWSAGADIRWKKGVTDQRGINKIEDGSFNKREEVEFGTGCCLLIPSNIVKKVGMLSEEYFLYYEDTDYCMKIKEGGYKIVYEPTGVLYHKVSASTGGELSVGYIYYNTRNRLIFNNKYNKVSKIIYMTYFYFTRIAKCCIWSIKGKKELVKATFMAIKDYNNGVTGKKDLSNI